MTDPNPTSPEAVARMSDDDLLMEINAHDPYDAEFARRFRALAAKLAKVESLCEIAGSVADAQKDRAETAEAKLAAFEARVGKLKAAFRVNMLRYGPPGTSHEEIDAVISAALQENSQ